jgi:hypothetical protein
MTRASKVAVIVSFARADEQERCGFALALRSRCNSGKQLFSRNLAVFEPKKCLRQSCKFANPPMNSFDETYLYHTSWHMNTGMNT